MNRSIEIVLVGCGLVGIAFVGAPAAHSAPRDADARAALVAHAHAVVQPLADVAPADQRQVIRAAVLGSNALKKALIFDPSLWASVRATLHKLPQDPRDKATRRRILELLVWDEHAASKRIVERVFADAPTMFTPAMLIALDVRGHAGARKRLHGLSESSSLAALHLCFQGRRDAVPLVQRAWAMTQRPAPHEPKASEISDNQMAMAAALARVGDPKPWRTLLRDVRAIVKRESDESFESVQNLVLQVVYFHSLTAPRARVDLSELRWRLQHAIGTKRPEATDVAALMNMLLALQR